MSVRNQVLQDIMIVLRAYACAWFPRPTVANKTTGTVEEAKNSGMGEWDRLARFPLIWAGMPDVMEMFDISGRSVFSSDTGENRVKQQSKRISLCNFLFID